MFSDRLMRFRTNGSSDQWIVGPSTLHPPITTGCTAGQGWGIAWGLERYFTVTFRGQSMVSIKGRI